MNVITLLIFQKRFFHHDEEEPQHEEKGVVETNTEVENKAPAI